VIVEGVKMPSTRKESPAANTVDEDWPELPHTD
jgi:hypothetical protein